MIDYDAAIVKPLLVEFLESFVPELRRRGYYTSLHPGQFGYMADLRIAGDPMTVKTTTSGIHASYVIDCGRPKLMVSLAPYRLYDVGFTHEWMRPSLEDFVEMCRTADRAPVLEKILEKMKEPGRIPPPSPKHWMPPRKDIR